MLHILWMLIKIIFAIVGILLGLAVLLVLLVLFCPVRYRAEAVKDPGSLRDTTASIRISWLFGGVSMRIYFKNRKTNKDFRLFGISVLRLLKKKKSFRRKQKPVEKQIREKTVSGDHIRSETDFLAEKAAPEEQGNRPGEPGAPSGTSQGFFRRLGNRISAFLEKLKKILAFLKQIPDTIEKFSLTIHRIYDKIKWWKNFIRHPRVEAGLAHIRSCASELLKHVFPRKIEGRVSFGSEDPSLTGAVLALLGMTFPLHRNRVEIIPVFENRNLLEGNVRIKGRVYGIIPVKILIRLYFDKNIKYIISRWKNKED